MSIPNIITIIRFALIPVYIAVNFSLCTYANEIAVSIFFLAMLLDVADGYIARKYNMITVWGKIMDPIADKCTMITVVSCLVAKDMISPWLLGFILAKELTMMICGAFIYKKGKIVIPANIFGKAATLILTLYIVDCVLFKWCTDELLFAVIGVMLLAFLSYVRYYIKNHFKKHIL